MSQGFEGLEMWDVRCLFVPCCFKNCGLRRAGKPEGSLYPIIRSPIKGHI